MKSRRALALAVLLFAPLALFTLHRHLSRFGSGRWTLGPEGVVKPKRAFPGCRETSEEVIARDCEHGTSCEIPRVCANVSETVVSFANEFALFCREKAFEWFAFEGSLIGAVRNRGFLPWDDDFDVGFWADEVDRFISAVGAHPDYGLMLIYPDGVWGSIASILQLPYWHKIKFFRIDGYAIPHWNLGDRATFPAVDLYVFERKSPLVLRWPDKAQLVEHLNLEDVLPLRIDYLERCGPNATAMVMFVPLNAEKFLDVCFPSATREQSWRHVVISQGWDHVTERGVETAVYKLAQPIDNYCDQRLRLPRP